MKSLWNAPNRLEILGRLHELSPDAARSWGTLTPHAALVHLADSLRMALGEITEAPIPGALRHQPLKWLAINVLPMPKGVKGPAGYFTNAPTEYEQDLGELERLIDHCANRPADATWGENPFFGRLTKEQWGRLAYKHVDHHLRQFGG
jgi:hypothetical protein